MADLKWNKEFAKEQSGGDVELLEELMRLLIDTSISDLEKIKSGLSAGDGNAVADAAHSVKGAAASLGVEGLQEVACEFEKNGRTGDLAGLDISTLESLVDQLSSLKI